jgi:3-hydroxy-9,10-secoandrosta-1,3,5(10)-triene-9,17-dione monooxygenase
MSASAPDQASATGGLLTPNEFVVRARTLKSKLRERAEECERIRRMPDATVADFLSLELYRIMLPKRFGGCEYGWDVWCECLIELAQGDASQAWVTMVHNEYVQLLSACSKELQEEIWGENPRALISSSFRPVGKVEKKDGGYTLSTVSVPWAFSSGIDEATWVIVGGIVPGRGHTYFIVPRSVVTVIDDWYASGLAGTGSKSFTIAETFVPEYRTISDQELNDGRGPGVTPSSPAISRYPRKAGAGLAIAAVPLGAAIGMLEDFRQIASSRGKRERAPVDLATGLRLAECAAELDAAKCMMLGLARESMQVLERGEELTKEQRLKSRLYAGYAALMSQRASERLYAAAGGMAIQKTNPLQRAFRDVHAAGTHIAVSWDGAASPIGDYMLGHDPAPGQW